MAAPAVEQAIEGRSDGYAVTVRGADNWVVAVFQGLSRRIGRNVVNGELPSALIWGSEAARRSCTSPETLPRLLTPLSARWKRCAWMQVCGVVKFWLSNAPHLDGSGDPSFAEIRIQDNTNVILLSPTTDSGFDRRLRVATLEKKAVAMVPSGMHP